MNQDLQDDTSLNPLGDSKTARASESWVFWGVIGCWGAVGAAVLYWVGVIAVSPLDLAEWIVNAAYGTEVAVEDIHNFIAGPLLFIRELFAGLSWAALGIPWVGFIRYRVGVIEAGSKEAYHLKVRKAAEDAAKAAPVGLLVGVGISRGGFLSSSETLVETSEGFFRVSGLIRTVKKGEPVFTLGDQLLIGEGNSQKRYTVVS